MENSTVKVFSFVIFVTFFLSAYGLSAPPWPNTFSVRFQTTVFPFCAGACCNKSMPTSCVVQELGNYGMDSVLYYDYTVQSERIDFSGCSANGTPGPCTFIFNATAGFLIQNDQCCQAASVGTVQPTWTQVLHYINNQQAYNTPTQVFSGGVPLHSYFFNNATNSPVQLLVHDINEHWHFTEPFSVGPLDPNLFVLPSNCAVCSSDVVLPAIHRLQ